MGIHTCNPQEAEPGDHGLEGGLVYIEVQASLGCIVKHTHMAIIASCIVSIFKYLTDSMKRWF